jgi:protease-4
VKRRKRYYLELQLKDEVVEGKPEQSFFSRKAKTALLDLVRLLEAARRDRRVAGISLKLESLTAGWARLSNIRRALSRFRESGKPIYCYLVSGGNAEYYVASACNHVFMGPAGALSLVGLASEVFFLREVLDRIGIEPQIFSVGEYKSAGEMFTRTEMSQPAREQWDALLDDYSREFCQALASGRGCTVEEMQAKIDRGPYSAREAVREQLLDGICYEDEVEEKIQAEFGPHVRAAGYGKFIPHDGLIKRWLTFRRPQIALMDVLGIIAGGESRRDRAGRPVSGAATIAKFLEHAQKSRRIAAVVVRIDSPGGTGLASDVIWRRMSLLAQHKPVVISFGDVAASGGYYISAPGCTIMAEPNSITGSIGVLGGKFAATGLLSRLSVHRESILRGKHSQFGSLFTPFSASEAERLQQQMQEFYREDFIKKVAGGRRIAEEDVDRAGRGRVWSGMAALKQRLVDTIGGLDDAVAEARKRAGIPERKKIRLVHYVRRRRLRELLMPDISPQLMGSIPDQASDLLEILHQLRDSPILLLMPFWVRIR